MTPEAGYPIELGASYRGLPILMYGSVVRGASGYAMRLAIPGLTSTGVIGASLTLGGNWDRALFTDPDDCSAGPGPARLEVDTWQNPGRYQAAEAKPYQEVTGCEALQFQPTLQVESGRGSRPASPRDTPWTSASRSLKTPRLRARRQLKQAAVTLPEGVSLSLGAANGLLSCAATGPEGINIGSEDLSPSGQDLGDPEATELGAGHLGGDASPYDDGLYHTAPGHCPETSMLGEVEITTPLLSEPLYGGVFLAEATHVDESGLGLYLEAAGSGVIVKLAGNCPPTRSPAV